MFPHAMTGGAGELAEKKLMARVGIAALQQGFERSEFCETIFGAALGTGAQLVELRVVAKGFVQPGESRIWQGPTGFDRREEIGEERFGGGQFRALGRRDDQRWRNDAIACDLGNES